MAELSDPKGASNDGPAVTKRALNDGPAVKKVDVIETVFDVIETVFDTNPYLEANPASQLIATLPRTTMGVRCANEKLVQSTTDMISERQGVCVRLCVLIWKLQYGSRLSQCCCCRFWSD